MKSFDSKSPNLVPWFLGASGLAVIGAPFAAPGYGLWISLIILVLVGVVGGIYLFLRAQKRKSAAKKTTGSLMMDSSKQPRAIRDREKLAKMDELRSSFQQGIQRFESSGKSLYRLPWYVFVGEPGSGKSEAIRRSGVRFPDSINDCQQGVGGTINMNWWFSNECVLLDTAGRLMFEEVSPGQSTEWSEFLKMLRKTRLRCPINGLVLCLPVDSLLRATTDEINQKAALIARQFEQIQAALDIRFPVYVLVTKCDLLTGFREFFGEVREVHLQDQMVGWSNPDDLDSLFRPDLVIEHLEAVASQLRQRRLSLLRDPISQFGPEAARMDEVDAMFALPESVLNLGPRLRRYLETIFTVGEWSQKPLFLRGIYFTSALQEGAELDDSLAKMLGIKVDDLPVAPGGARDRAFFLRDLFLKKVVVEQGLVTTATNVKKMVQRRKLGMVGGAAAAALALLVFAGFGYKQLKNTVVGEAQTWKLAAEGWGPQGTQHSVVQPQAPGQPYRYAGDDPVGDTTVAQFHERLRVLSSEPLPIHWVFKPVVWLRPDSDLDRQGAQLIVFNHGVVEPLVQAMRTRLSDQSVQPSQATAPFFQAGLRSMIQLEADILNAPGTVGTEAKSYLESWIAAVTEKPHSASPELISAFEKTYGEGGKGAWAPSELTGGDSLNANVALQRGLSKMLAYSRKAETNLNARQASLNQLRDASVDCRIQELSVHRKLRNGQLLSAQDVSKLITYANELRTTISNAEARLQGSENPQVAGLGAAYGQLTQDALNASGDTVQQLLSGEENQSLIGRSTLFAEIKQQFDEMRDAIVRDIQKQTNQIAATDLVEIDSAYLAKDSTEVRFFDVRHRFYEETQRMPEKIQFETGQLVGSQWLALARIATEENRLQSGIQAYDGPLKEDFDMTCKSLLDLARNGAEEKFLNAYQQELSGLISDITTKARTRPDASLLDESERNFFTLLKKDQDAVNVISPNLRAPLSQLLVRSVDQVRNLLVDAYRDNRLMEIRQVSSLNQQPSVESLDRVKSLFDVIETELGRPLFAPYPAPPIQEVRDALKRGKTTIASQLASDRVSQLRINLGFPILLHGGSGAGNSGELVRLKLELESQLKTPAMQFLPADALRPMTELFQQIDPVLKALFDDKGRPRACKLTVQLKPNQPPDGFGTYWRQVGASTSTAEALGESSFRQIGLGGEMTTILEFPVDQPLKVQFRKGAAQPADHELNLSGWAAIQLIRDYPSQPSPDRKSWGIKVPIKDAVREGFIWIHLDFDQPLPALADWSQIGN